MSTQARGCALQYDTHMPELTVAETLDFSARCQGAGLKAGAPSSSVFKHKEQPMHRQHTHAYAAQSAQTIVLAARMISVTGAWAHALTPASTCWA